MDEHSTSDQWKLSGICQLCRRQPYCKTQCKANRTQVKAYTADMIQKVLQDSGSVFPALNNELHAASVIPHNRSERSAL